MGLTHVWMASAVEIGSLVCLFHGAAPLVGFVWFSCLLDLTQLSFEDLLSNIEASSLLPLLHMAAFPVPSRADS